MSLSASNFKLPLLRALAYMSKGQAGVPIPCEDLYPEILADMVLSSLEAEGFQEASGKPWIQLWIGWAHREMKKPSNKMPHPFTGAGKRGFWTITQDGLDEVGAASGSSGARVVPEEHDAAPEPEGVADTPVDEGPPVASILAPSPVGDLDLGPGSQIPGLEGLPYHEDPTVTALALPPCFSFISAKSSTCGACAIRCECAAAYMASVAKVAESMMNGTYKKATKQAPPTKQAAAQPAAALRQPEWDEDNKTGKPFISKGGVVCYRCNKAIAQGARAFWVQSRGAFHTECQ